METQEAIEMVKDYVSCCDEQRDKAQKSKTDYLTAIDVLEAVYDERESSFSLIDAIIYDLKECISYFDAELNTAENMKEGYSMAVSALERQIPKGPVHDEWGHNCCPTCGYAGIYKDEWGGRYIPYCENCGQAINWEKVAK